MKTRCSQVTEILTSAQMRAAERTAIDSGAVTGRKLMQRAGQGVVDAIFQTWQSPDKAAQRAVILCGPGNNGGDGFVIARALRDLGWQVEVFLFGDSTRLPPDAQHMHDIWAAGQPVRPLNPEALAEGVRPALLVDALFGTGLTRAIPAICARAAEIVAGRPGGPDAPSYHVAVDIPSGMDADSGRWLVPQPDTDRDIAPVHWDLTVTFHRLKTGHLLSQDLTGQVRLVDIGLEAGKSPSLTEALSRLNPEDTTALEPADSAAARDWMSDVVRKPDGHKFVHGHALVLAGGVGRGGAARLAARGALRIGAGLVTLACPPAALQENASRLDAIMLHSLRDGADLRTVLQDRRVTALCLGPGMGLSMRESALVEAAIEVRAVDPQPWTVVLDADALTRLAQMPQIAARLHPRCVLTPHDGEFARLFPDLAARLGETPLCGPAYSRRDAARDAARRAGCVVVLKGAVTVIAHPLGHVAVHAATRMRAAPWLATAGAGDVLAGMITGLAARGVSPFAAACQAVWLHVEAARAFGPGLIAEDLPETLPRVLDRLAQHVI